MTDLTLNDIDAKTRQSVYTQDYAKKGAIDGVQIFPLKNMVGEDGDFLEVLRCNQQGTLELVPDFSIRQVNHSTQFPNAIKAWHLHFKQNEIWYVPPSSHFLVGLWDVREASPTKDATMRIPMGGGIPKLLYIPKGVAHGAVNLSQNVSTIIYVVDQTFSLSDPDEKRLPWDAKGAQFWQAIRD